MASDKMISIKEMGANVLKNSVISIFLCILMNISFGVLQRYLGNYTDLINQIFDIALLFVLLYGCSADYGSKDFTLVEFGGGQKDYKRGVLAGLYAVIPYYVFTLPLLIMKIAGTEYIGNYLKLYRVIMSPFMVICKNVFSDLSLSGVSYPSILLMFVLPLIATAGVVVSYIIGFKKIDLKEKLVYKDK